MANSTIGSIAAAIDVRDKLLGQAGGKVILHQQYPDEYEYYMFALELLDSTLRTKRYFIFPIMPQSMSYNDTPITKITKTAGGISVLKSDQFIPKSFTCSGTFGRSYKVLIGQTTQDLVSSFREDNNPLKSVKNFFDDRIKTGYGCTKILEEMLQMSNQKDESGGAHFLVMYNLAFNHKFFVEYEDFTANMGLENNMMWNYSLKLKCIAPSDSFLRSQTDQKTSQQLVVDDQIQKAANKAYGAISNLLNKQIQSL